MSLSNPVLQSLLRLLAVFLTCFIMCFILFCLGEEKHKSKSGAATADPPSTDSSKGKLSVPSLGIDVKKGRRSPSKGQGHPTLVTEIVVADQIMTI